MCKKLSSFTDEDLQKELKRREDERRMTVGRRIIARQDLIIKHADVLIELATTDFVKSVLETAKRDRLFTGDELTADIAIAFDYDTDYEDVVFNLRTGK